MNLNPIDTTYQDGLNSFPILDYIDDKIASGTGSGYISSNIYSIGSNLFVNNSNTNGEIKFQTLYKYPNNGDVGVKIDSLGKLQVYHNYNVGYPLITEGYFNVEDDLANLKFSSLVANGEMLVVQGQISGINTTLGIHTTQIAGLESTQAVHTAILQEDINNYNFFSDLINFGNDLSINVARQTAQFKIAKNKEILNNVLFGAGLAAMGGVVAGIYNTIEMNSQSNLYLNASNGNITQNSRDDTTSNFQYYNRRSIIELNSNLSNAELDNGFINSNILTKQVVPYLRTNKIEIGNITTPNSSYQLEMTGDLNTNMLWINSTSLTTLLNQKQNNMTATQPIFITTANIGLNYDSSLTKVGNNLSVVKTATAPLNWTGNDIALSYDSTLLNNSGSLGVSIAAESKWGYTGANIYNKTKTNVGIGTDSGLTYKLNVIGDTYLSSNTHIGGISKLSFISSYTNSTLTSVTGTNEYYLQYTGNGTLVLTEPCACDLLVVGAGGNGGTGASSGGGGAGEVIYYQNFPLRNGTLNINVGTSSTTPSNRISSITHTSGTQISAKGGGDGGTPDNLFTANGSIVLNTNALAIYNYTSPIAISPASYTITFSSGSITLTGLTADKSYPLLKDGSGNTINPTAWYKFDSGNLLTDSSPNNLTLTNTNAVSVDTTNFVKGDGSSSYLASSSRYLSINNAAFNLNSSSFSISVWVRPTLFNVGNETPIFATGDNNNNTRSSMFFQYTANGANLQAGFYGETTIVYALTPANELNVWTHWCWTYNTTGNVHLLYKNGSYVATFTGAGPLSGSGNNYRIGGWYLNGLEKYFTGNIDDFRLYKSQVLSATQISELYKGRVVIYANPTSGGSGGGGAKSQTGAAIGTKFDDYKSFALSGLSGNSTTGGNGGAGNTTYSRYTTTITGSSLSVALGGTGVGTTPATPTSKTNYGDGGDGNGGVGYQGIVIIRFKADNSYLHVKAIKDNGNCGLILNANETPNSYQLRIHPWSDTYQLTGIATRGWSFRCHDGNNNLDLLNLFSSFGGRIGIKTKNPTATFDVNGDINCKTFSVIGNELYGITCQVVNQHDTGEASINVSAGASGNYGAMSVVYLPSQNLGYISCSKSLQIKTQSVSGYIHIDNTTGNVGIGNNAPSYKLVVSGTIGANDIMVSGSINATTLGIGQIYATGIDNGYFNNLEGSIVNNKYLYSSNIYVNNFIDCQNKSIYNCSNLYGTAEIAKEWKPVTNYWHKDDQGRQRFYFRNDPSVGVTDHYTMIKSGSYTIYFRDKDDTDYLSADRFGLDTYFPVTTSTTDYLAVLEPNATGTWQYRRMMIKYGSFTEFHRVFVEDDLYIDYDDFMSKYVGRVMVSTGKTKHAKKEAGDIPWEILEDKDAITIDDSQPVVELSRQRKDKRVYGIVTYRQVSDYGGRICVNGLGEGGIWIVNTNGDLGNGDYLQTSNEIGYAEKQDDDILHNYTIAKIIMDCNFELDSPKYKCEDLGNGIRRAFVGCVYLCS